MTSKSIDVPSFYAAIYRKAIRSRRFAPLLLHLLVPSHRWSFFVSFVLFLLMNNLVRLVSPPFLDKTKNQKQDVAFHLLTCSKRCDHLYQLLPFQPTPTINLRNTRSATTLPSRISIKTFFAACVLSPAVRIKGLSVQKHRIPAAFAFVVHGVEGDAMSLFDLRVPEDVEDV